MKKVILNQTGEKIQEDLNFTEKMFAVYDTSSTYAKDNVVRYGDKLYKCKTNNTTGTWDSSKWDEVKLNNLLGTKLYKHSIKYRGGYVYIINKSSSPISDRYYVPMAMNSSNCVSAKYNSGVYYNQILRIVNGEYDDTIYYIDEYGQVGSLPVEFQNDTVTEL